MTNENLRHNAKQFILGLGIHFGITIISQIFFIVVARLTTPQGALYFGYVVFGVIVLVLLYFLIKKQWYIAAGIATFFVVNRLIAEITIQLLQP